MCKADPADPTHRMDRTASPPDAPRRRWVLSGARIALAAAVFKSAAARAQTEADLNGQGMPYAAFDRLPFERVEVGDALIRVAFGPGEFEIARGRIVEHVRRSARAVAVYFGRFPARTARVLILSTEAPGRPIRSGTAFGYAGAAIKLTLSASVRETDLERDWILVHEMCHLALPSLPRRQHWFEEGMASYVEPFARAQAGALAIAQVWRDLASGLPQGLPQAGDQGLEHTFTWGRTYWGGALFCLLADVRTRQATAGERGLQHALRAMLAQANIESDSTLETLLAIGDRACGTDVLSTLHAQMKNDPHPVDLDALLASLGVRMTGGRVSFDDAAPLARIRIALTQPPTAPR